MRNPNRPAIPNARDAAKIRRVVRPALQNTVPEPNLPITSPSYFATADATIAANDSGPFTIQNETPDAPADSPLSLNAYTLSAVSTGDTVLLTWVSAAGSGGGYWLAVSGATSLCFSPCDLFSVLDSLTLSDEAQATLDTMKAACGCDVVCDNCPTLGRSFNLDLSGVIVTQGFTVTLDDGFSELEAEVTSSMLQGIMDAVSIPVEVITLVDAETCVWEGSQEIVRNILVQRTGLGSTPGIPGTYQFTFRLSARLLFGDDWRVEITGEVVEWNADPAIMGSIFSVDVYDQWALDFASDPNSATACGQTEADVITGSAIAFPNNSPYNLSAAKVTINQG